MYFKSLSDLARDVHSWIPTLKERYECVVGIPRSGMFVANILALKLGIPFADLDGFLEGRLLGLGDRYKHVDPKTYLMDQRNVLVVDDSISSGNAMRKARTEIEQSDCIHKLTFMAAYVTPKGKRFCDAFIEEIPNPRRFEWNILSSLAIGNYCFDLEGVLCADPDSEHRKKEGQYRDFIRSAQPLYLPTHPIGMIATNRPEKFRAETEEWLARYNVSYGALHMPDSSPEEVQLDPRDSAPFKAEVYRNSSCDLFIESNSKEAIQIVQLSNKFVYALDTVEMLRPGVLSNFLEKKMINGRKSYRRIWTRLKGTFSKVNGRKRKTKLASISARSVTRQ